MFRRFCNFIRKHAATFLCGVAVLAVPLVSQECQMIWFQEEEPDGMEEFRIRKRG